VNISRCDVVFDPSNFIQGCAFALLRSGLDLGVGMAGAIALYGSDFSPMDCAKALVYFKGGDLATVPAAERSRLINAVRLLRISTFKPASIRSHSLSLATPQNI